MATECISRLGCFTRIARGMSLIFLSAACGGRVVHEDDLGSGIPGLPVNGSNHGDSDAVQDRSLCEDSTPDAASACGSNGLLCTYGNSARFDCRTTAFCESKAWVVETECDEPPEGYCPDPRPSDGQTCEYYWLAPPCLYDNIWCSCVNCPDGQCDSSRWECIDAVEGNGCPVSAPNLGDSCDSQGLSCRFGDPCNGGISQICRNGYWDTTGVSCEL